MEIRCPACGKINSTAPVCPRCECDLSALMDAWQAAHAEAQTAKACLDQKNFQQALHHAGQSWQIKKNPVAAKIAFFASLGAGLFEDATRWYLHAEESSLPGNAAPRNNG